MNQKINTVSVIIIILLLLPTQVPSTDVNQHDITTQMKEHSWRILERLNWLRNEEKLCDITIIVGDRSFRAHKLVLSAGSSYFEAMFANGDMRESMSTEPVTLHDLDAEAFEMMKNYIYTGRITIDDSTVQRQLAGASYLQMTKVEADCCAYMKNHLNAMNCMSIKYIADKYSCADLLHSAAVLALDAFEDVALSDEFLRSTEVQLIDIISDDELAISEDKVYEAVMRWIKYQDGLDGDRTVHLQTLMQHVRFSQMEPRYLERLSEDPMIRACERCLEYVMEAKDYLLSHYLSYERDKNVPVETRFKPRKTYCLFAVGGYINEESTSSVEKYDHRTDKWTEVSPMKSPRKHVGVAALDNMLYVVCGFTNSDYLSSIECYDLRFDKWTDNVKPLEHGRDTHNCVATLNGNLYVIGGLSPYYSALQSVMKYDPSCNEWIECKLLRQKRSYYATGVLDGYIYVLGGTIDDQASNTVERYDPIQNEWHRAPQMITKRYSIGATAHGGHLYASGGIGEDGDVLNSVERYDPRKQIWDLIPSMREHRCYHGLAVANGLIYAVGGRDLNQETLNTVEVYDSATDIWSKRAPMLYARNEFGLAAMKF